MPNGELKHRMSWIGCKNWYPLHNCSWSYTISLCMLYHPNLLHQNHQSVISLWCRELTSVVHLLLERKERAIEKSQSSSSSVQKKSSDSYLHQPSCSQRAIITCDWPELPCIQILSSSSTTGWLAGSIASYTIIVINFIIWDQSSSTLLQSSASLLTWLISILTVLGKIIESLDPYLASVQELRLNHHPHVAIKCNQLLLLLPHCCCIC